MTITYPLSLPSVKGPASIVMRTTNLVAMNRSHFTGIQSTITYPGPWWEADVTLPPMREADAEEWIAFLLKLRGRAGTFLMGDPTKATPRGSAATAPGTPVVNGADQTGNYLNISGMPTSVTNYLKTGDNIQLGTGSASTLHKLLEPLDSDSSGEGTATLWPRIRVAPSDGAAITVANPRGLFRLKENNPEWAMTPGTLYNLSFNAMEVL